MIKKRFHFFFLAKTLEWRRQTKGQQQIILSWGIKKIVHHPAWHGQYTRTNLASKLALGFHQTELADYMKVVLIVIVHL